jgi:Na+/proline symporter
MATRAMADSVRVFASAIPIALIIGPSLPKVWVMPASILLLGVLTIVYTYKGGMRAVVWTELLQAGVYATGGLAAIVLLGHVVAGGWPHILDAARSQDKLRVFDFYTGLDRPHTIWAGVIGGAFLTMASHGADQTIVQRMLSARSLRDAQKAIIGSGIAVIVMMTLFLTVGIGLWSYFAGRPFDSPDTIFPTFIFERMPHGMIGLLVASILAATMSTHSGAINSLAATTTLDIYLPLSGKTPDDPSAFRMGRWFALAWGIILTGGALLFPEGKTPVVVIALSIASFTQGALLGAFFLGILNRRAQQRDAIVGMSVGIGTMAFIVFAKPLSAAYPSLAHVLGPFASVAWPWYVLIGLSITLAAGSLMALTHVSPTPAAR